MMLTLHFYRVYPVINSSMEDRRGKERPRSSGSLEFLRWRNNWRFTSLQISLSFSGKIRLVARAALLWQKYRRINSSSRQDANDSSTDGGGGGGEGAHTHACMQHRVASKRSFESAGPILNTCLHRLSRTFFWRLENFSLLSLLPSLSLVDSFIHKGNRVSRMYTLTFATFLLYVHVYTMKRFLARLSVSS